ncbi:MAG TPA: polysaccharide biosynthesis/export family protein [Steroidobacteraceae bacterium]|nr:polysaccharide biosynthesis/export family protein [Steroidobacteraceae bacterium]
MKTPAAVGLLLVATLAVASDAWADRAESPAPSAPSADRYLIQPGDLLVVSVWKEQDLQTEVLVLPDGGLSFPLVGDFVARGKSVQQLRDEITERLRPYVPDPVVTVAVKQIGGNRIYVLGKVNRPGEFPLSQPVDVMQALSLAGGTTAYAAVNDIVILRRENGVQQTMRFHYADVARGKDLAQNVLLRSGDTVVVP